jgi:hypothetical protein
MDDWKKHDSETGGFYKCNRYNPDDLKKKLKDDERYDGAAYEAIYRNQQAK